VSSILSNAKSLLRLALDSLIESVRNDPAKYSSLIYNCNNNMSMSTTNSSYMYGGQQQQHYIPSQDYFIEHYTAMLLHEAEKLYTKLVKDLTNRVVSDMAFSNNIAIAESYLYRTDLSYCNYFLSPNN
jgi:hypothetical protein